MAVAKVWDDDLSAWVPVLVGEQGPQGEQGPTGPSAIVNTDGDPGQTLYVGTVDPDTLYTLAAGDVWLEVPS